MVYIHSSVSECKSTGSANFSRNKKAHHNPNPSCDGFRSSAAIDIVILIAVIAASGFLLHPYAKLISVWLVGAIGAFAVIVKEEVSDEPIIYFCITVGVLCSALSAFGLVMCCFSGQKCDNPNCRGLRKAAEFDIQLETEECVKGLSKSPIDEGLRTTGMFELPRDHHKELEAELKKMAPPNGRAVLLFKGRCGCAVGKMEVPGPKRRRKVK